VRPGSPVEIERREVAKQLLEDWREVSAILCKCVAWSLVVR
jgi:hypothetical protein